MKDVAIVIPIWSLSINKFGNLSLFQMINVFKNREIIFCCPEHISLKKIYELVENNKSVKVEFFEDKNFFSIDAYNKMLLSDFFYKRFSFYRFILIAQLDSFTFSDRLDYFISLDFDFIGAPWFEGFDIPISKKLIGVGNGGYSLRNVSMFAKNSEKLRFLVEKNSDDICLTNTMQLMILDYNSNLNEDVFWHKYGKLLNSQFSLASFKSACDFSFEVNPSFLYKIFRKLPMGCHGFLKYESNFWESYIPGLSELLCGENEYDR